MAEKVVVTGRGLVTPLGIGLAENIEALKTGKSGIIFREDWQKEGLESCIAGTVTAQLDCPLFERKKLRFMPSNSQMAVVAAYEAMIEAGYTVETLPKNMALINGCAGSAYGELVDGVKAFEESRNVRRASAFSVPRIMPSSAVANMSLVFGITGESYDVSCACTSGAVAIMTGARLIKSGEYDIVMVGGSEETTWQQALGFNAMRALSKGFNDTPDKASRPFDKARDGFVIAEGAGIMILESESHAKKRGAKILSEISGYASNSNGCDMVVPKPEATAEVMSAAIANARLTPNDIDYINTHGTSTPVGDPVELQGIMSVFGDHKVAINSTKSQTGHMIGPAGAVEAIFCSLMIEHSFISKSVNLDDPDDGFEKLDLVRELRTGVSIKHALSNSFGFGGTNATLIISKYE